MPYDRAALKSYFAGDIKNVSDEEFKTLLGREIPDGSWTKQLRMNDALCQAKYARSPLFRLVYHILNGLKNGAEKKGEPNLNILFIYNMPFRGLAKMTGGAVNMRMAEGILDIANWHFFRGMGKVIGGAATGGKLHSKKAK